MTELNTTSKKIGFSSNIVSFVSLVGFFILLLPMPDGSIYGYGTIFFALLGILMLHLALVTRENMEAGLITILKELLLASETLPIVGLMTVLGWLISMNIMYWDRFNNPEMLPDEFKNFKGLATGLLGISVILVQSITGQETKELQAQTKGQNNVSKFYKFASESGASILYLVITILTITVGLMQTIMKYYITDG
tara:strand:+ start:185 stop:769 length:585 start_codon:yes stop_codon:yes gene_type:complete